MQNTLSVEWIGFQGASWVIVGDPFLYSEWRQMLGLVSEILSITWQTPSAQSASAQLRIAHSFLNQSQNIMQVKGAELRSLQDQKSMYTIDWLIECLD